MSESCTAKNDPSVADFDHRCERNTENRPYGVIKLFKDGFEIIRSGSL